MKRGSPRTMKTCLPTRCRGGPAGPPRADAWVGPYLSFSEQDEDAEVESCLRRCSRQPRTVEAPGVRVASVRYTLSDDYSDK